MRLLLDWSGILALIPLIIGMVWDVADEDITSDIELSLFGSGVGIVFTIIAMALLAAFWVNFARLAEVTEVMDRYRGGVVGVVAITGLGLVSVTDGGWILFGIAQLGLAYVCYRTHLLPTGFGIVSGVGAAVSIIFGIVGAINGGTSAAPVFVLIGWSVIMTIMYLNSGHPEELRRVIPERIRSSREVRTGDG